jgi:hypothetical protein
MRPQTIITYGIILFFFLVSLLPAFWFGLKYLLENELSRPRNIAGINFIPYNFHFEAPFTVKYDSLHLSNSDFKSSFHDFEISVHIFSSDRIKAEWVTLKSRTLNLRLFQEQKIDTTDLSKPTKSISMPEILLPVPGAISINNMNVKWSQTDSVQLKGVQISNRNKQDLSIYLDTLISNHLPRPASLKIYAAWTTPFLDLDMKIRSGMDSISISAEAPKNHLERIQAEIALSIQNPKLYYNYPLEDETLKINNLTTSGSFQYNLLIEEYSFNLDIGANSSEYWPLPEMKTHVKTAGTKKNIEFKIVSSGDSGEKVELEGTVINLKEIDLKGKTSGIKMDFEEDTLPANFDIENFHYSNDNGTFAIVTSDQSKIRGKFATQPVLSAEFNADISPTEPWAIQWTGTNMTLGNRNQIFGKFSNGILKAHVKTSSKNVYYQAADTLMTDLILSENGITFENGMIWHGDNLFPFNGKVIWGNDSLVEFEVTRLNGGKISITSDFSGSFSLIVDKFPVEALPLADSSALKGFTGVISADWVFSDNLDTGLANVKLETFYKNIPLDIITTIRQQGGILYANPVNIRQNTNYLTATLDFSTLDEPNFRDGFDRIINLNVQASNFSLPVIADAFMDSLFSDGVLNGSIAYDQKSGFSSQLRIANLQFKSLSGSFMNFPRIYLDAFQDKVQISGRMKLGYASEWDSEIALNISDVLNRTPVISGAVVADNGGILWFDTELNKEKELKGSFNLKGPWIMPSGIGELKKSEMSGSFYANLDQGLEGLSLSLKGDSAQYSLNNLADLPLAIDAELKGNSITVHRLSISNPEGEQINAKASFDLNTSKIRGLKFATPVFNLKMNDGQQFKVENLIGEGRYIDDDFMLKVDIPSASFLHKSSESGTVTSSFKGELSYTLLSNQNKKIQSGKSLTGKISVTKLIYEKYLNLDLNPFSAENQKRLKQFFSGITGKRSGTAKMKAGTPREQRPTELDIDITAQYSDSIFVTGDFFKFPFTFNLSVGGNTIEPLIKGNINSTGDGFLSMGDLTKFNLNSFQIVWQDDPLMNGQLTVDSFKDLPYCDNADNLGELCPVHFDLGGELKNPEILASGNCNGEMSPGAVYYSVLLDCIALSNEGDFDTDRGLDKTAGILAGKGISHFVNLVAGEELVRDVELNWHIMRDAERSEFDSNSVRVPLSLDRWVKNMSLILGYTQGVGSNPRYDNSKEIGLKYDFGDPFRDSVDVYDDTQNRMLSISGNLVSKQYLNANENEDQESRLEKAVSLGFSYNYWNPIRLCLLGIGLCEDGVDP